MPTFCKYAHCRKRASYGYHGNKEKLYCNIHRLPSMVYKYSTPKEINIIKYYQNTTQQTPVPTNVKVEKVCEDMSKKVHKDMSKNLENEIDITYYYRQNI